MTLPLPNPLTPESPAAHEQAMMRDLAEKSATKDAAIADWYQAHVDLEFFRMKWLIQQCATEFGGGRRCEFNAEPGSTECSMCRDYWKEWKQINEGDKFAGMGR